MTQLNGGYPLGRFIVFDSATYYPSGGFSDFIGSADTPEDARIIGARGDENVEIVDQQTGATWWWDRLTRKWRDGNVHEGSRG